MMTAASHGTSIALNLSSSGPPCRARSLQQASEALREHMLPHLGFPMLMALSRASPDWHQLISTTPLAQLSGHVSRDMLPHGMYSHQPLCEVLQERGSLVARLRRDHKPLQQASHDTVPHQHSESHVQGMCILSWSPQPDISQPSQHILILRPWTDPYYQGHERIASILDLPTGWQIESHAGRSRGASMEAATVAVGPSQESALRRTERHSSDMVQPRDQQEAQESISEPCINIRHAASAAWASDGRHAIITLASPQKYPHPDAYGRNVTHILADVLLRERALIFIQPHERFPRGGISPAGNMLLSQTSTPLNPDIRLDIYLLPSFRHHFFLAPPTCPDNLHQTPIKYQQFAWSPDGSKIAVWWVQNWPTATETASTSPSSTSSISDYVTIDSADDGTCLTSILLDSHPRHMHSTQDSDSSNSDESSDEEDDDSYDGDDDYPGIEWDSTSSYILWTYKDTIACICPEGGQVWQSSCRERLSDSSFKHVKYVTTNVGSAASGRYLSIADHLNDSVDFLTMLDAMTGKVMSQWSISVGTKGMIWSAQSDVCLLSNPSYVLIPTAAADPAAGTAQSSGISLGHVYWAFSPSGLSSRRPVMKSEASEYNHHSWHKFALAAPAPPDSNGTSSPANVGYETHTMHISPCGTVVVGVKQNEAETVAGQPSGSKAMFQHWHLPHVHPDPGTPVAAGNGAFHVRPHECIGLVMPSRMTVHLAWHPQPRACTYACYDYQVGLRLVDARLDCIVRSWNIPELCEYICEESAETGNESSDNKLSRLVPGSALAWSHDGCRLAVLVGKHCAVLHF